MNRTRSLFNIGNVYGKMLGEVIVEKATSKLPGGTFPLAKDKKLTAAKVNKNAFIKKSGPADADGVQSIIDPKTTKKGNFYEPEKYSVNLEKNKADNINNYMSKSFDDLFKQVINDRVRLNENDDEYEEVADDMGGEATDGEATADLPEGEDELTPREKVMKAIEMLQGVLDSLPEDDTEGGDMGEEMGDMGEGDEAEEDMGEEMGEGTDIKEIKDEAGKGLTKGSNKVGGVATTLAKSGKANSKFTDKVGADGDLGTPLVNQKKASELTKGSKVAGSSLKPGQVLFQ